MRQGRKRNEVLLLVDLSLSYRLKQVGEGPLQGI